jgi:hypothetical protein
VDTLTDGRTNKKLIFKVGWIGKFLPILLILPDNVKHVTMRNYFWKASNMSGIIPSDCTILLSLGSDIGFTMFPLREHLASFLQELQGRGCLWWRGGK